MKRDLLSIIKFITEVDKLKAVTRQNNPININRRENSAEHSWQVALLAMSLGEYSNRPIDINRVIKMLILHDIVEIDAGDVLLYNEEARAAKEVEEITAAKRIFSILPKKIADKFISIWLEFEKRESNDAIFAYAMDRVMPVIQNFSNKPSSWEEHGISKDQVIRLNSPIGDGVEQLWIIVQDEIDKIFETINR